MIILLAHHQSAVLVKERGIVFEGIDQDAVEHLEGEAGVEEEEHAAGVLVVAKYRGALRRFLPLVGGLFCGPCLLLGSEVSIEDVGD